MQTLGEAKFSNYQQSVTTALDLISAAEALSTEKKFLIKPNLVNSSPHPVTTSPDFCRAVIEYVLKANNKAEIIIAEGSGDSKLETPEIFKKLGYMELAEDYGIELLDLNYAPLCKKSLPGTKVFPEMYLPEIAFTHKIISMPNLKGHSMAGITGTMKNMMGFAPPEHYSLGGWKKAAFHKQMQQSVKELNMYISPWLSIMDASVGLADYHLGGARCNPSPELILAGFNPKELDRRAAEILGLNWQEIGHLC
ncbi:DUF362 domain-containing protein [Maridesulfovibrio bastinii]|uniref:DUF362 domain-containing protein n=1 Tax=Maridesulfovibrio bastinii TaxID=47157 RepID=UPI00042238FF|nr:DUF362 domain-containing protein [Maridesulfovibrio bastinii]